MSFASVGLLATCVDRLELSLPQQTNIIVVDGLINDLPEPQIIQLSRAQTDSVTGRFGVKAITQATVEVLVDSALVIPCHETTDGRYQLPADFRGQPGHAYQLRFTLRNGSTYASTQQRMPAVPPIQRVALRFNPTSFPRGILEDFQAGFEVLVDVQDPPNQPNYYRWDWKLWEKQAWCQSCQQSYYMTNQLKLVSSYPNILIYQTQPELLENCFGAPSPSLFGGNFTPLPIFFTNSYTCRTECWDIIASTMINIFSDSYSNGGLITNRNIGQIPYYTQNPALVEVGQTALTPEAYRYFSLLGEQTQRSGGLADGPPTAIIGNIKNLTNQQERLVGYFSAGARSSVRYWLDKKEATGPAYGSVYYDVDKKLTLPVPGEQQLFYALNRDLPRREAYLNFTILGSGSIRPPSALCLPGEGRTPIEPLGWKK